MPPSDRLQPLLERTEYRLRYLAAAELERHRDFADQVKPFQAYGCWLGFSRYRARAEDLLKFLQQKGK